MPQDLAGWLSTVVASGIGTLAAAFISFRFTLAKLRKERAIASRAEWYEQVTTALWAVARLLRAKADAERAMRKLGIRDDKLFDFISRKSFDISVLLEQAPLYASRDDLKDLADLKDLYLRMGQANAPWPAPAGPVDRMLLLSAVTAALAKRFANSYRSHLGMELLDDDWEEFKRSLRELDEAQTKAAEAFEKAQAGTLSDDEGDYVEKMLVAFSDDGGATWALVHAGDQIWIKVLDLSKGMTDWKVVYEPRSLITRDEFLEREIILDES